MRDSIGRLLFGAYQSALYDNEVKIRELTREFDAKSGELRSLFAVLGKSEHPLTREWLAAQRQSLEEERKVLQSEIDDGERALFTSSADDKFTLAEQEKAYAEVQKFQLALGKAFQERDALRLSVADSAAFITDLEGRLKALNDASTVAHYLGDVRFKTCPACYAPLDTNADLPPHVCHLCKTPFETERTKNRIVAMINDVAIQIKQSQLLQEGREERLRTLENKIESLENSWRKASERLSGLQGLPSSGARERLRELHRRSGYLDRQIEDLNHKSQIVRLIEQVSSRKDELNQLINHLKSENERLRASQEKRFAEAYTRVADQIRNLLRMDLRRQDSFENPNKIEFDFASNRISVDGHSYFSASSRVILRVVFFLVFLSPRLRIALFDIRGL
jgi:DNA repair exonuclease SbcCD ATPase subunit